MVDLQILGGKLEGNVEVRVWLYFIVNEVSYLIRAGGRCFSVII